MPSHLMWSNGDARRVDSRLPSTHRHSELDFTDVLCGSSSLSDCCARTKAVLAPRCSLLIGYLAVLCGSLASTVVTGIGIVPCLSPTSLLTLCTVVICAIILLMVFACVPLPEFDCMPCLLPFFRTMLIVTAFGAWILLSIGGIALQVMIGHDIYGAALADFQVACAPQDMGTGGCWEHRCGGITRVFLNDGLLAEELETVIHAGIFSFRVTPVIRDSTLPQAPAAALEDAMAFALRWWSTSAPMLAAEARCNASIDLGICGTLLWGNIWVPLHAVERFFRSPLGLDDGALTGHLAYKRPLFVPGDPEKLITGGLWYAWAGAALLIIQSAILFILVWRTTGLSPGGGTWYHLVGGRYKSQQIRTTPGFLQTYESSQH